MIERTHGNMPESSSLDDGERLGQSSEFAGRLAAAVGLVTLFFAVWLVKLPEAADWTGPGMRILPRLSVLTLGIVAALLLQGCRRKSATWALGALLASAGLIFLHGTAGQLEIVKLDPASITPNLLKSHVWTRADHRVFFHGRADLLQSSATLLWLRFECAIFAAIFLGTWIGRGVKCSWHFVALLAFGALADWWLNRNHVTDGAEPGAALSLLRIPCGASIGGLAAAPSVFDLVFVSATLEGARIFRMHMMSLVLGALAGYWSGSFLGLAPAPALGPFSMALLAFGVLTAAWPDLEMNSNSMGKLFLAVALMFLTLSSIVKLQRNFNPPQQPKRIDEPQRARDTALEWRRQTEGRDIGKRENGAEFAIRI